jgi:hypothetical protein
MTLSSSRPRQRETPSFGVRRSTLGCSKPGGSAIRERSRVRSSCSKARSSRPSVTRTNLIASGSAAMLANLRAVLIGVSIASWFSLYLVHWSSLAPPAFKASRPTLGFGSARVVHSFLPANSAWSCPKIKLGRTGANVATAAADPGARSLDN